jgi:predicted HTH transcriptional regulator
MTPFLQPLPRGESLTVEFKTSFNEDVSQTLVAFANAKGGSVFVGVSDSGEAKGVTLGAETLNTWLNEIKLKTTPQLIPEADYVSRPRNRLVAQIFKDAGWIEKYGSGIKRVRAGYEHHGMAMPEYRCDADSVMVISRLVALP